MSGKGGGQKGNRNAQKGARALNTLNQALAAKFGTSTEGLVEIWRRIIRAAMDGESWAALEIVHRVGGKPAQSIDIIGDMTHRTVRELSIEELDARIAELSVREALPALGTDETSEFH